ncbi:MAG: hypothetical protein P4M11_09385 [Candidatus Pacebacteria bacterium]|nr:hypothetical protein [Candidatus Paceibacterota bacterium]
MHRFKKLTKVPVPPDPPARVCRAANPKKRLESESPAVAADTEALANAKKQKMEPGPSAASVSATADLIASKLEKEFSVSSHCECV